MRGRKRIKLSPMQRVILAFPGGEGLASVRPLLDQLRQQFPATAPEDFVEEVGKALLKLRRLGALSLERRFGAGRRAVEAGEWENFSLRRFVVWDGPARQWAVSDTQGGADDILIRLSRGGVDDLRLYELQNSRRKLSR